jgi:hypothetical protein
MSVREPSNPPSGRKLRLSAALRENLKRRKAQARGRAAAVRGAAARNRNASEGNPPR